MGKRFILFGIVGALLLSFCGLGFAASVNLNTADVKALVALKGVGEKRAQDIVTYRKEHGAFKKLDDLLAVKGITPKRLAKLESDNKNLITLK